MRAALLAQGGVHVAEDSEEVRGGSIAESSVNTGNGGRELCAEPVPWTSGCRGPPNDLQALIVLESCPEGVLLLFSLSLSLANALSAVTRGPLSSTPLSLDGT